MEENSGSPLRTCSIHYPDIQFDKKKVILFTHQTLKTCSTALKIRGYNKLKGANFILPTRVDEINGYHSACYKQFTAIQQKYRDKVPPLVMNLPTSSRLAPIPGPSVPRRPRREGLITSSGVMKKICLFCGKKRKMHAKKEQNLVLGTDIVETKVLEAAAALDDRRVLTILDSGDFVAKECRYHSICMKRFLFRAKQKQKIQPGRPCRRELNEQGYKFVYDVVEKEILLYEKVFTLSELYKLFKEKIESLTEPNLASKLCFSRPAYLEEKLMGRYPLVLRVDRSHKEHVFFKSTMDFVPKVVQTKMEEMKHDSLLRDTAFSLRKEIANANEHRLPSREVTLSDLYRGECQIPVGLKTFVGDLIYGPTTSKDSSSRNLRIDSICSDIMFTATNGRMKPSKQLLLGSATKTLTGSKKMLNILNRLGHSVSYHSIEEIETELSYSSHQSSSIISHPIKKLPNLFTSVAFNNFDRFVETLTGKNTLHDTVGIIFQNKIADDDAMEVDDVSEILQNQTPVPDNKPEQRESATSTIGIRRRRSFEEVVFEIQPYMKNPKLSNVSVIMNPQSQIPAPKDFKVFDILWALKFIHIPESPMWVGFNAELFLDNSPSQTLSYLPQINASPTSYAVVRHTLKMALQVMDECSQSAIFCTYDLNIAKMALEIQCQDQPQFNNVFVGLGPFHIEMAMFKALGKYIDGSGIVEVLNESGILAHGSVSGFIGGTNYNRCKRIHRLLAISLRKLHYDLFRSLTLTETEEDLSEDLDFTILLENATNTQVDPNAANLEIDPKLKSHIEAYLEFEKETASGTHGLTAQIWIQYIRYIDLYNDFNRSVRMGDIVLFVSSLSKINDLFFIMNHQNYSRWLVPFTDNVINAVNSDNSISAQLKKGFFSVKRTNKRFSRTPVDLTLEQTINADAGNKLSGIISVTNSISARQRWAYSHSQRTEIVSHLLDDIGLTTKEDVTNDLRKGRITRDREHFLNLLEALNNMINPFDDKLQPSMLFNLCTGKSASENVSTFLKNVPSMGNEQHLSFRKECSQDFSRFYKPLKRNKILNFLEDRPKVTIRRAEKTQTLKTERNLFCRLLTISLQKKIDLQSVLTYPLTSIPLSLGHHDGTPVKTQKSVLLKYLEGLTSHDAPGTTDVLIIDGFYFLHQFGNNLPATYGLIAKAIMKKLRNCKCSCIHLIFDRYVSPSIKDLERDSRSAGVPNATYHVSNPHQKRPTDFNKAMRSVQFKQSLVEFLIKEWSSENYAEDFQQFALYVNREETCYFYYSLTGSTVTVHEEQNLKSGHVEADSRMVYHLTTVTEAANVVIRTCDTDVLVILIGNLHNMKEDVGVWLETGTLSRNDHRYINIRKIADQLGPEMSKALPSLHALTGCDYTSAFFRIGKKKPFSVVKNQEEIKKTLSEFGESQELKTFELQSIEKLVCQFYSRREFSNIDELRLHVFMDAYQRRCDTTTLTVPQGIDSSNFPPCKRVLFQHLLRAKFVTLMWSNLQHPDPPNVHPADYGWEESEGCYTIRWYEGPALPESLEDIIIQQTPEDAATDVTDDSEEITDSSDEDEVLD